MFIFNNIPSLRPAWNRWNLPSNKKHLQLAALTGIVNMRIPLRLPWDIGKHRKAIRGLAPEEIPCYFSPSSIWTICRQFIRVPKMTNSAHCGNENLLPPRLSPKGPCLIPLPFPNTTHVAFARSWEEQFTLCKAPVKWRGEGVQFVVPAIN